MYRIEYQLKTMNNSPANHVVFVDTLEEAADICDKVDLLGYKLVDISNYIEDV